VRLETTTIYVKVARPADGQAVPSPLDVMTRQQRKPPEIPPSVGKLRFHFKPEPTTGDGLLASKVTLGIEGQPRTTYLTGIVAREIRRDWVSLDIPPLEQWEEPSRWLSRAQRERLEAPEFFELLQREIPKRLLAMRPG